MIEPSYLGGVMAEVIIEDAENRKKLEGLVNEIKEITWQEESIDVRMSRIVNLLRAFEIIK